MVKTKQPLSKAKKILIIISAILCLVMVAINCWWFGIYFFGKDKVISNTFEVGLQTTTSGESRNFAEINYYKNKDDSGVELLDLKYNYMLDENKEKFYSQGIQIVANSSKINWAYQVDASCGKTIFDEKWILTYNERKVAYYGSMTAGSNTSIYNYASGDNYESTQISSNELNYNSSFKIQLGRELYLMKFRGNTDKRQVPNTLLRNDEQLYRANINGDWGYYLVYGYQNKNYYYSYYDPYYFTKLLYDSIQSLKAGTNQTMIFEFGDIFDYYECTDLDNGVYAETPIVDTTKVRNDIKSYYSIKVNIHENGAKSAGDSIFNCLYGSMNYNMGNTASTSGNYYFGRDIINLTNKDFELVDTDSTNCFKLKLKTSVVNSYLIYKDVIALNIELDLDEFKNIGASFDSVMLDSLAPFTIYKIQSKEIINSNVVYVEVVPC